MNKKKILKLITNFDKLDESKKQKLSQEIAEQWQAVYDEYCALCNQDVEFLKLQSECEQIDTILNYSFLKDYCGYEPGYSFFLDEIEIEREEFEKDKQLVENFDNIQKSLTRKYENLKDKKDPESLAKKRKITKQIQSNVETKTHYEEYTKKIALQKHYLDNEDILIKPIKNTYLELSTKYATQVLNKHLKLKPLLLCEIPTTNLTPTEKSQIKVNAKALFDICKEIKLDALLDAPTISEMQR